MNMFRLCCAAAAIQLWLITVAGSAEALGTAISYQGKLRFEGEQVTGVYDLQFLLYDALENPATQIGNLVDLAAVQVEDGLFTVQLDFGTGAFDGDARWLEIRVRPNGSGDPYTTLTPRQAILATPYALYSLNTPPTAGGLWALNGDRIYNLNDGRVGIGTAAPSFNLDVYETGGTNSPPTTFGVRWLMPAIGSPRHDWFYFAVGGSAITVGSGTRMSREEGTELHFQTRPDIDSGFPETQVMVDAEGRMGIGTMAPDGMLTVLGNGKHCLRATTSSIPVYAHRDGTSGTWPAIHAECDSGSGDATAIRAYLNATASGTGSAAVKGVNRGTANGCGVKGIHEGTGCGVIGEASNGRAVYGLATSGDGVWGICRTRRIPPPSLSLGACGSVATPGRIPSHRGIY